MTLNGLWLGILGGQITFIRQYDVFFGVQAGQIAYPFNSSSGFGARYAAPATGGNALSVAVAPNGNTVLVSNPLWTGVDAWVWNRGSGFGTKYADPATQMWPDWFTNFEMTYSAQFNPAGNAVVATGTGTPYIHGYAWSSGFGSKYANPASPLPGGNRTRFTNGGNDIVISSTPSPFIHAYAWSSGFGAKRANPATLPGSAGTPLATTSTVVAVGTSSTPFITAYAYSGSGFGSKFANPATLPSTTYGIAFNPSATALAITESASPYFGVWAWSAGGWGARFSNPATLPPSGWSAANTNDQVAFSPDGASVTFAGLPGGSDTAVVSYAWSSGFGARIANFNTVAPPEVTQAPLHGVAFSIT